MHKVKLEGCPGTGTHGIEYMLEGIWLTDSMYIVQKWSNSKESMILCLCGSSGYVYFRGLATLSAAFEMVTYLDKISIVATELTELDSEQRAEIGKVLLKMNLKHYSAEVERSRKIDTRIEAAIQETR